MKVFRPLILSFLVCFGSLSLISLVDFHQTSLASCDPPPEQPKKPPKK